MKPWQRWVIGGTLGLAGLVGGTGCIPYMTGNYSSYRPEHFSKEPAKLETIVDDAKSRELPLLYLKGTPYEVGWQRGQALKRQIHQINRQFDEHINENASDVPLLGPLIADIILWNAHQHLEDQLDPDYKAEIRGMADACDVSVRDFKRHMAVSELFAASCSSFAAANTATEDGRLIQTRNLDWNIEFNFQDYSVIEAVKVDGKNAYASVTFAGFPGVLSGINEHGISVSEIGAASAAKTLDGTPMVFLLRKVLEEAKTLDQAVNIIRTAKRTGGYNYIIGSAWERKAAALETNAERCAVFPLNDPKEAVNSYARPLTDVIVRGDWALDDLIRERQRASGGDPDTPGIEPPSSGGYTTRYKEHTALLAAALAKGGKIDVPLAMAVNRAVAMKSNIQSVVYDFERDRMYVKIAKHHEKSMDCKDRTGIAAEQPAFVVDLRKAFAELHFR